MMTMGGGLWIALLVLLLFLLLIGGLAAVIVWLVTQGADKSGAGPTTPGPDQEDALEILRRRYARGELSREEYLAMREDLTS